MEERNDFKINQFNKEIDLSFADELVISKKRGYLDEVLVKVRADNDEIIKNKSGKLYLEYKDELYILINTKNESSYDTKHANVNILSIDDKINLLADIIYSKGIHWIDNINVRGFCNKLIEQIKLK